MSETSDSCAAVASEKVRDLLDATSALRRALRGSEGSALEAAVALRQEAIAGVVELLGRTGTDAVRTSLAEMLRMDAELLEEARARLEVIRRELRAIQCARDAARKILGGARPPRFVSRRV